MQNVRSKLLFSCFLVVKLFYIFNLSCMEQQNLEFKIENVNFESMKLIGVGGSKKVYRVNLLSDPNKYAALAIFDKDKKNEQQIALELNRELYFFDTYKHENIITLYDFSVKDKMLLFEYGFDNLYRFISNLRKKRKCEKCTSEHHVLLLCKLQILIDLLSAVVFLHKKNIIYRDLKPENIVFVGINDKFKTMLIDPGSFVEIPEGKNFITDSKFAISIGYVDPNIYKNMNKNEDRKHDIDCYLKNDIYSIAMIIFFVIYEHDFFKFFLYTKKTQTENYIEIFLNNSKTWLDVTTEFLLNKKERLDLKTIRFLYKKVDTEIRNKIDDLICKCWDTEFENRPTAQNILDELIKIKKMVDEQNETLKEVND